METFNKPKTPQVGVISKAQKSKRTSKCQNSNIAQYPQAKKCERGDPLGIFNIHFAAKYQKKLKGDPLVQSKSFRQKSHSTEKSFFFKCDF